jgi:hypothetical protein
LRLDTIPERKFAGWRERVRYFVNKSRISVSSLTSADGPAAGAGGIVLAFRRPGENADPPYMDRPPAPPASNSSRPC